jgi:hypothetical protein
MSVCDIRFEGLGDNFGCGNDENQITPSTVEDPQAAGNAIGVLDIGHLLNKGAYFYCFSICFQPYRYEKIK